MKKIAVISAGIGLFVGGGVTAITIDGINANDNGNIEVVDHGDVMEPRDPENEIFMDVYPDGE
ncbi:hypothetical protein ACE1TF_05745 [Geomicrobium sp. JSM 1781026]|uniref:hypothetical protein n=1 Tax=Geomicrobium sp. JSM 1781026 TaxID=3344580 RepID=UPI0035BF8DA2